MILRRDRNFAGAEILDRLIPAAMPEFQFECLSAKGESENLMAETNAEDRFFADQSANGFVRVRKRAGSPGPFERKTPSGLSASVSSADVVGRHDGDAETMCRSRRRMFSLIP